MDLTALVLLLVSLMVFTHALFSLHLMLYAWEHPERLEATRGPASFEPSRTTFSVLLPAYREEAVIYDTITRIWAANYPHHLLELIVACHADDVGTIAEATRAIRTIRSDRARIATFSTPPINKPHALNVAFRQASGEVVTVFDAEDDVDPFLFDVINTVMLREDVGVVQAGVQLMNHRDHWFSLLNCLEYFFWFQSRLHFHAKVGMIPLAGNTVFIRRELVRRVDGWDERCLTEDADIGLRLSTLGETIRVVYDVQHVTREETPSSIPALIRQRTRWNQGFLQVLGKGSWLSLPTLGGKLLAFYTFSFPIFLVPLTLLWPLAVIGGLWIQLPVAIAMVTFLPLYAVLFLMLVNVVGAGMFSRTYGLELSRMTQLAVVATFIPYQLILGWSSARAVVRQVRRHTDWEKTEHVGAHRHAAGASLGSSVQGVAVPDPGRSAARVAAGGRAHLIQRRVSTAETRPAPPGNLHRDTTPAAFISCAHSVALADDRFCGRCGARLAPGATDSRRAAAPRRRHVLTVLGNLIPVPIRTDGVRDRPNVAGPDGRRTGTQGR